MNDPKFFFIFPILLLSVAIHEFAHCWITDRLGDDTPRLQGRVTLNPLAHLDPIGTVMMVVSSMSGFGFGWGKASPMNPYNFRHPARDRMWSALAGPLSNIIQMLAWASLGALLTRLPGSPWAAYAAVACSFGVIVNAVLAAFNLLPIYPLDGHHILSYLAPPLRPLIDNPNWQYVFFALIFIPSLRSSILHPYMTAALKVGNLLTTYLVGWSIS